jgi:hypothetical protein
LKVINNKHNKYTNIGTIVTASIEKSISNELNYYNNLNDYQKQGYNGKIAGYVITEITLTVASGGIYQVGKTVIRSAKLSKFTKALGKNKKIKKIITTLKGNGLKAKTLAYNGKIGKLVEGLLYNKYINKYSDLVPQHYYDAGKIFDGGRYFDLFSETSKIAIESKSGYVALTKNHKTQLLKDVHALLNSDSGVETIIWEFTKNPKGKGGVDDISKPFKKFVKEQNEILRKAGKNPIQLIDSGLDISNS